MDNPIEVERHFLELTSRLEAVSSLRLHWKLIKQFLIELNGEFARFDSYVIQLSSYFPVFRDPLSYAGTDPEQFDELILLLKQCEIHIPELNERSAYREARDALIQATGLLYAWTGTVDRLVCLFITAYEMSVDTDYQWVEEIQQHSEIKNIERLKLLEKTAREKGHAELADHLLQLINTWNKAGSNKQGETLIPVVESSDQIGIPSSGRLRRLQVQLLDENHQGPDQLKNNFAVWGAEKSSTEFTSSIVDAYRGLLQGSHPGLNDRFFNLQLTYRMHTGWHTGASMELAGAALCYCSILKATGQRERYDLKSGLVLTGRLNSQGDVKHVAPSGIPEKVNAAFYSWASYLVVPSGQLASFEEELKKKEQTYPGSDLQVIGIDHLEELFYDRRLTRHTVESHSIYYAKELWKKKTSVAGIGVIIALLIMIARLVYGPLDNNPVAATFEGKMMNIENKYGSVIRQINVGAFTVDRLNGNLGASGIKPYAFFDLNRDGTNEILWAKLTGTNEDRQQMAHLHCTDAVNDSLVWSIPLNFELDFPRKGDVSTHFYVVRQMEYSPEDDQLLVLLKHPSFFPGILLVVEPGTGKLTGSYIHVGHIKDFVLVDLEGDRSKEIVALAQNNAFDEISTLAVLDPNRLDGHSPLKGDYILNSVERANEIKYLAIPQTIVGRSFRKRVVNNSPQRISVNPSEKLIEVRIHDFYLPDASKFEISTGGLILYFDYSLQLQSVGTTSHYDLWAKNLYEEGRIPFKPDYDYFQAFKDSILYWDGERFVPTEKPISSGIDSPASAQDLKRP